MRGGGLGEGGEAGFEEGGVGGCRRGGFLGGGSRRWLALLPGDDGRGVCGRGFLLPSGRARRHTMCVDAGARLSGCQQAGARIHRMMGSLSAF